MKDANDFWNEIPSTIQAKVDNNTVRIKSGVPEYQLLTGKTLTATQQTAMDNLVATFNPADPSQKELVYSAGKSKLKEHNGNNANNIPMPDLASIVRALLQIDHPDWILEDGTIQVPD